MKKFLVLFMLATSLTANSQIDLHLKGDYNDSYRVGPMITLGGAAFLVGGILSAPDKQWVCLDNNSQSLIPNRYPSQGCTGRWENKPFWRQGPKMMATVIGVAALSTGIVITIGGK